jgi:phenylacetic acid degradation operon negative regulatory protein
MLGEFVLPAGGTVWTSTIIDGLSLLGVNERNARQAAARLSEQGLLESERIGRVARWNLTDAGRRLLDDGADRIYGFGNEPRTWSKRWLVIIVSVPEDDRAKRHQLRSRLGFEGFGFLGPGVAVSPHPDREAAANEVLDDLGLAETAIVLLAETGTLVPDLEIIRRAWDLDELAARYEEFADRFARRRPDGGADAFAAVVELVHEWRRFPFDDPEIPDELLPDDWPGQRAGRLFDARRSAWGPAATDWYRSAQELAGRAGSVSS